MFIQKMIAVVAVVFSVQTVFAQFASEKLNELSNLIYAQGLNPNWYAHMDEYSAVERIAKDLSIGRVSPASMNPKVRIEPKKFSHQTTVQQYLFGQISAAQFVETVRAKNKVYNDSILLLRDLLERKAFGRWVNKPDNLKIEGLALNSKNNKLVHYLRFKLNDLGYANDVISDQFDEELFLVVQQFQRDHNLKTDGIIGKISWSFLERPLDQLIGQASLNIDRARWLPDDLGANHIFVNLAQQRLKLTQNGQETMDMITINGRVDRQTPLLVDRVVNIVLNPTWTVPFSIFVKDKLPVLRQDPGYIARNHMKVVDDNTGLEVDPYSIDWSLDENELGQYTIVQLPGPWNALGFAKFTLSNPFAIYLHDTSDRHLFNDDLRLLSSGCVRVSNPFELAERLLDTPNWTQDKLREFTEYAPTIATKDTWLKPKVKMPVYLFYQTLFRENDGRLISLNDHYNLDQVMYFAITND